jgi:hypothetical protein
LFGEADGFTFGFPQVACSGIQLEPAPPDNAVAARIFKTGSSEWNNFNTKIVSESL